MFTVSHTWCLYLPPSPTSQPLPLVCFILHARLLSLSLPPSVSLSFSLSNTLVAVMMLFDDQNVRTICIRISSLLWGSFAKETYNLIHTATHCKALQYTAIHCNILQHTATRSRQRRGIRLSEYRLFYGALLQKRPII